MRDYRLKKVAIFLITVLIFNFLTLGFIGNNRVEAGFWDDHKGSVLTVVKGMIMLWIINLMSHNSSEDSNDDFITSTIKKGLNLDKGLITGDQDQSSNQKEEEVIVVENSGLEGLTSKEIKLIDLLNQARLKKGLNSLSVDLDLVALARKKAQDMIEHDYFSHQSPTFGSPFEMMKAEGIDYTLAGENLAGAKTIEKAFALLMDSPEHKENILKLSYDKIGIGVIEKGPYGLMIVQLFIDSPDPAL